MICCTFQRVPFEKISSPPKPQTVYKEHGCDLVEVNSRPIIIHNERKDRQMNQHQEIKAFLSYRYMVIKYLKKR